MIFHVCDNIMKNIDLKDRKILYQLDINSRQPLSQIAKKVGVAESTIRSRYASLVERGIVQTIAVIDPFSVGYNAPAMIGISTESGSINSVVQALEQMPEVSYLVLTLGGYDLMVEVFCRDREHLTDLLTNQIQSIPGIRVTETLVIGKIFKLSFFWQPEINAQTEGE